MSGNNQESGCGCKKVALAEEAPVQSVSRRNVLLKLGAGLNALAGLLIGVPVFGYVLSTFSKNSPRTWVSLGDLNHFPEGNTRLAVFRNPVTKPWDGDTNEVPCWVRRVEGEKFQVFAINCTHLGCPVRWFQQSRLFMCPCHGGVFYEDGSHASGPPPRGLFEYQHKVDGGELKILGGNLPTLSEPT
jgi:quinol---cytochrome c reductase iron-sulfur subunit, bacillus type